MEDKKYYTFACDPPSGNRRCRFVSETQANRRKWTIQHHDAHVCNQLCDDAVGALYPIRELKIRRPAPDIDSVSIKTRCEPDLYEFVAHFKLDEAFEGFKLSTRLIVRRNDLHLSIQSNDLLSATENAADFHTWLGPSALRFPRKTIQWVLKHIQCASYAGSATEWSMQEARRAFQLPGLAPTVSDTYRMAPCRAGVDTQVTMYPQTHKTLDAVDHPVKYEIAFQQWRLLKYLAQHGKRFDAVFNESGVPLGLMHRDDGFKKDGDLPKSYEGLNARQLQSLFDPGAVFIARRHGYIGKDNVYDTATDASRTTQAQEHYNDAHKRNRGNQRKLMFDDREAEAVSLIQQHLTMHPSHRVLLVFGAEHDTFLERFRDAGISFCTIDPRQIERLPFLQR